MDRHYRFLMLFLPGFFLPFGTALENSGKNKDLPGFIAKNSILLVFSYFVISKVINKTCS